MMTFYAAYGGNNNGRGNGRGGNDLQYSGDGDSDASEQLSVLPLAVAVALCAALYPALEAMAAPSAAEDPKMQLDVVSTPATADAAEEELDLEAMHSAISALLGESSQPEALESRLVLQLA
jgi:hypothetical protein